MNLSKELLLPSKKTLLETLWYIVTVLFILGIGSVNASAQTTIDTTTTEPFHKQASERLTYLVTVERMNISVKSIAFEAGLSEIDVVNILIGKAEIADEQTLDLFCEALLCDFEITYPKGKRRVKLLPKEKKDQSKVYSKSTGEIIFYVNN